MKRLLIPGLTNQDRAGAEEIEVLEELVEVKEERRGEERRGNESRALNKGTESRNVLEEMPHIGQEIVVGTESEVLRGAKLSNIS